MTPHIREATTDDRSDISPIVREVVVAGDMFAYRPEMTEDEAPELGSRSSGRSPRSTTETVVSSGLHIMYLKLR